MRHRAVLISLLLFAAMCGFIAGPALGVGRPHPDGRFTLRTARPPWTANSAAPGQTPALSVFSAHSSSTAKSARDVRVQLGNEPIPASAAGNDRLFSFVDAAESAGQATSGSATSLTLEVVSSAPGAVTVFPPELRYDPA